MNLLKAKTSCYGHAICLIDSMILTVVKKVMTAVIGGLCRRKGGLVAMKTLGTGFLCVGCLGLAAAALARGGGNTVGQHSGDTKYRAVMFRVKAQGLVFIGCTWQWSC